jgi:hypothetical protein
LSFVSAPNGVIVIGSCGVLRVSVMTRAGRLTHKFPRPVKILRAAKRVSALAITLAR